MTDLEKLEAIADLSNRVTREALKIATLVAVDHVLERSQVEAEVRETGYDEAALALQFLDALKDWK